MTPPPNDRDDALLNAARGRDACGINHEELERAAHAAGRAQGIEEAIKVAAEVMDHWPPFDAGRAAVKRVVDCMRALLTKEPT